MPTEREVFLELAEIEDPSLRQIRLDELCGNDAPLREGVIALLEFHGRDTSFLEEPFVGATESMEVPIKEVEGATIGKYKLLEKIGEGGFGIVYMAEQSIPVDRRVALKIIKLGMDTKQVIGRFEAERQALALMDHPNIAKVFDGGSSDSGRPYFVMELVNGIPITQFCDENKLGTAERIDLVAKVCQALQHAHRKGIIHRDIKPSNILVTVLDDVPVPKVIDFGIAKATQQRLTERTVFTRFQHFIGTPAYMSPEQAAYSGVDVDTRSDVYSVGVLLYELLTGTTPLSNESLRDAAFDEVCRLIREEPSQLPSARLSSLGERLSSVATNQNTDAHTLQGKVRGELDWIVMKALEKDRSRRYESATALASDLHAYLHHEPVQAAPPSLAYQSKKYLEKNWRFVAAITAIMCALALGTIFSAVGFVTASKEVKHSRRLLYASDVNLCGAAISSGNIRQAKAFLANHIATDSEQDLRTFPWHYMWRQLHLYDDEFKHDAPVHDVVFSADGRQLISAGESGCVKVWNLDLKTSKQLQTSLQTVTSTSIGPHEILAVGGRAGKDWQTKGMVELWNSKTHQRIRTLDLPTDLDAVVAVEFIPDSTTVLIASVNNLLAYDTNTDTTLWRRGPSNFRIGGTKTRALAISRDAELVATSGGDGIFILNATTGESLGKPIPLPSVRCLGFSVEADLLAVGQIVPKKMFALRVVDLKTLEVHELPEESALESLSVSPRDGTLATLNWRGQIGLWDMRTRKRLGEAPAHANAIGAIQFNSAGTSLATCGQDRIVRLWTVDHLLTPDSVTHGNDGKTVSWYTFSNDNQSVVSSGQASFLKQWDTKSGKLMRTFSFAGEKSSDAYRSHFSHDDQMLVSASNGGEVTLWDVKTGEVHQTFASGIQWPTLLQFSETVDTVTVGGLDPHETGYDLKIVKWDIRSGEQTASTSQKIDVASSADAAQPGYPHFRVRAGGPGDRTRLSPDLTRFAVGYGSNVLVGEVKSGKVLQHFKSLEHAVVPVQFSIDGKLVAAADQSQTIRVWSAETGEELKHFETPTWPGVLAFAPDSKTLAAGYIDGTIGFWDLRVEREILNLDAHVLPVTTLQFSSDGKTLASGGWDGAVRIWRTE